MPKRLRASLCIDDYDCIGFDLDHTLCRYNVANLARLVFDLLAEYLVTKKGYDASIRKRSFDEDLQWMTKGLTLDCERGNILRLGSDGAVLVACHGTRKMSDHEIERLYGRDRRRHPGHEYIQHLTEFGPQNLVQFSPLLHCFMDYFDLAAPLLCARIVDMLDAINNDGKPMAEYYFWPDVHEGLRELYLRTHFAANQGGFFPALKSNPENYILKRSPEFRAWLHMLRENGKFLYVITGSHYDFASYVASYAIGEDWKDLFDIVIFFARKPSFFVENRPFWRLNGPVEVESFKGWEDLETGECYSQGNWKDLNEFFEYCTEWEPSNSLYFGDNVLQDVLAPKRFTSTIDSIAISEEMLAEGLLGMDTLSHPDKDLLTSDLWGSYFYYPPRQPGGGISSRVAAAFRNMSASVSGTTLPSSRASTPALKRVSSLRVSSSELPKEEVTVGAAQIVEIPSLAPMGPMRINTLWGTLIRDQARMCIPDLEVLTAYPIDYRFPAFGWSKKGDLTKSGFFPADPKVLHTTSSTEAPAGPGQRRPSKYQTSI